AEAILGERPQQIPPLGGHRDLAFEDKSWAGGGNALVDLENLIVDAGEDATEGVPLVHLPVVALEAAIPSGGTGGEKTLYFRIPPNEQLLAYWDTVAQRLDNIRNSRTIDGRIQKTPLLAAKINPAVLADAIAAGISVADAIAMAEKKAPPYRFHTML